MQVVSFELRPSKIYLGLMTFVYAGALFCVFLSNIPKTVMGILMVVIAISFVRQIVKHIKTRKITFEKQTIKTPFVCTPWVVELNFARQAVIVFWDAMDPQLFRRLRVTLMNDEI